jgi:putative hydrolase of the HAD superfamily
MSKSRAVIWDFDGTLAERPGLWSSCLLEILDAEDPDHRIRREDIAAHMRSRFPWHTPERAHPELCDPDAWWSELTRLLATVCERIGYPREQARRIASLMRARYVDGAVGWRVFPDAHTALQRLRDRGHRQVILSNHVPELAAIVDDLGLAKYFDAILTSALTGFEKPHASAYAAARQSLPGGSDLWMVGDSEEADYLGPEREGIRGVLLWRKVTLCPQRVTRHAPDLLVAADLILAGAG